MANPIFCKGKLENIWVAPDAVWIRIAGMNLWISNICLHDQQVVEASSCSV
jgi:hypothetical protein